MMNCQRGHRAIWGREAVVHSTSTTENRDKRRLGTSSLRSNAFDLLAQLSFDSESREHNRSKPIAACFARNLPACANAHPQNSLSLGEAFKENTPLHSCWTLFYWFHLSPGYPTCMMMHLCRRFFFTVQWSHPFPWTHTHTTGQQPRANFFSLISQSEVITGWIRSRSIILFLTRHGMAVRAGP